MIIFSALNYTGTPDQFEILGAKMTVTNANAAITAANNATTPPGTAPLWPMATNAELKASYLAILLQGVANTHASYAQIAASADSLKPWFSEVSLQTIRANHIARRQAGETEAQLVTDSAA